MHPMDYASEQSMEIEALQAIFMDDIEIFEGTLPDGWARETTTYRVTISPLDEGEESDGDEKLMELLFAHTPRVRLPTHSRIADSLSFSNKLLSHLSILTKLPP